MFNQFFVILISISRVMNCMIYIYIYILIWASSPMNKALVIQNSRHLYLSKLTHCINFQPKCELVDILWIQYERYIFKRVVKIMTRFANMKIQTSWITVFFLKGESLPTNWWVACYFSMCWVAKVTKGIEKIMFLQYLLFSR